MSKMQILLQNKGRGFVEIGCKDLVSAPMVRPLCDVGLGGYQRIGGHIRGSQQDFKTWQSMSWGGA